MLTIHDLYLQFGDRVLFNHINLVIKDKDKIGLVGRNGAGKSTLLKMIAGDEKPDSGNVARPTNTTLGFLYQEMALPKGKTVLEETLTAFDEVNKLEEQIEQINVALGERTDYESDGYTKLIEKLTEYNERFLLLGGNSVHADTERVLKGLGFKSSDMDRLTDTLSGGWQMRIELAKMLLQKPDYLLLDEPTNHLDIESIIWLENFLKDYFGAVIVISHDKQFLDNITKRTVEIEGGKTYDYKAPYSKFINLRQERRALQQSAFENQQKVIAQKERTINRFMAKATKTKMAQSMKKQLDKIERIEVDDETSAAMNIRFPKAPRSGEVVVKGTHVQKKYGDTDVLDDIDIQIQRGERVAFVGQNGQGKTTLSKILIDIEPATKGDITLGHNVEIGYYAQNQSDTLDEKITLLETMELHSPPEMRTKLRSILGAFLFSGEDVDKKVMVLSGGERARLALACMLLRPFNLLVLDEPTNHLDIVSKDILKRALMEYDGTLIVVSHDRDFLQGLTHRIVEFRDKQLFQYIGDINAFLEKRALDNMREVERRTKSNAIHVKELSEEEKKALTKQRKLLQRNVQNEEKKVEKLEKKISETERKMGETGFYESPDADKTLKLYQQTKAELEIAMENWETAQLEWEKLDEGH